ncbi:MAG: hypothetical protein R3F45_13745 [Gammaproteobacteria bacterium]
MDQFDQVVDHLVQVPTGGADTLEVIQRSYIEPQRVLPAEDLPATVGGARRSCAAACEKGPLAQRGLELGDAHAHAFLEGAVKVDDLLFGPPPLVDVGERPDETHRWILFVLFRPCRAQTTTTTKNTKHDGVPGRGVREAAWKRRSS